MINTLNAELNPICHLLVLLGAHPILYVSRIKVKYDTHRQTAVCTDKKRYMKGKYGTSR